MDMGLPYGTTPENSMYAIGKNKLTAVKNCLWWGREA